jgi:hypothetical protein
VRRTEISKENAKILAAKTMPAILSYPVGLLLTRAALNFFSFDPGTVVVMDDGKLLVVSTYHSSFARLASATGSCTYRHRACGVRRARDVLCCGDSHGQPLLLNRCNASNSSSKQQVAVWQIVRR